MSLSPNNASPNNASAHLLNLPDAVCKQWRIKRVNQNLFDFGVDVQGGLHAGILLARVCLGDMATVSLVPGSPSQPPVVQVFTDQPATACMGCQYGGWPVSADGFFAIGSGPIRLLRGREKVLEAYGLSDKDAAHGVLVLESGQLPDDTVMEKLLAEVAVDREKLLVCVAATKSLAGSFQIVARSVESTIHKLHELDIDLNLVTTAHGTAPLPAVAADDLTAIGRTNDSIMYAGHVTMWVDMDDDQINDLGPRVPSNSSPSFGRSFKELFEEVDGDFYKMDPMIFSAAMVRMISNLSGNAFTFGKQRLDLVIGTDSD